ncbi:phospholipid methyltransferase-domain-containing protein [Dissophora ornata]|nr:phospholipid methyltransferase-domain-containing protein [Dissophora ornata]
MTGRKRERERKKTTDRCRNIKELSPTTKLLIVFSVFKSLGIKGMYNGDSFGFLFDAPVMDGPYKYFSDPQYVGTTLSLVGTAVYYQSIVGYILAVDMYIIFWVSVMFFEGPHMRRIYSQKKKPE